MRIRILPAAVAKAALFSSAVLATAGPAAADTSVPISVGTVNDTVVGYNGTVLDKLTGLPQV
ncbi:hypothetical protein ACFV23_44780 [Streptomyces sp. NPDC059627]